MHTTYMLTAPLLHPLLVNMNVRACQVMLMNIYLSFSPRFCFEVMFCDFYSPLYLHCLSTPRLITSLLIPSRADLCIPLTILHLSTGCIWVCFIIIFLLTINHHSRCPQAPVSLRRLCDFHLQGCQAQIPGSV